MVQLDETHPFNAILVLRLMMKSFGKQQDRPDDPAPKNNSQRRSRSVLYIYIYGFAEQQQQHLDSLIGIFIYSRTTVYM